MQDIKEAIQNIKSLNDLKRVVEYYNVKLTKSDKNIRGCCPFHSEKTPSFYLSDKGAEAFYKCFGCGASGDIINFIQSKEGLTTLEAVKKAYDILGLKLDIQTSKLDKLINYIESNSFYKVDGFYIEDIHVYMINEDTPSFLKVKYRSLTDKSKKDLRTYKVVDQGEYFKTTTKEKGGEYTPTIYNYPTIKKAIEQDQNVYFVEGEKDVKTLQRLGLRATTIYSKKWFNEYSEQLKDSKIVFIGDTGEAGEDFKKTIFNNLKGIVKTFKVVDLPGIDSLGDNADITDWLNIEANTKELLIEAIKDSWDLIKSEKWADVDIKETKNGTIVTPKKTLRNFEIMLKRTNTTIQFNEISKVLDIKTTKFDNKNLNTFATEIYSYCQIEGLKLTPNEVMKYIDAIGYKKSVNPFKEYLEGLKDKWDGKSRLKDFYNVFTVVEGYDNDLKELILNKWLLQIIGSAYDNEFKSPGLIVLKGRQGLGKTSIFRNLIPMNESWVFLEEQHFTGDRDNIQSITSNQIVEFSEFARSNKAVDQLKAFVTSPKDKMVLKYDKHPIEYKRRTVYYATVNDSEFLLDDENRRFWVVDVMDINLNHSVNFNQLWAEIYDLYHNKKMKNYWLSNEEQQRIEASNQRYKFKGEMETLIEKSFNFMNDTRIWLTTIEVIEFLNSNKDIGKTKVTRTLKSMGIEQKPINNKDMPRNNYNAMPMPKLWNSNIPPQYKVRVINRLVAVSDDKTKQFIIDEQQQEIDKLKKEIERLKKQLEINNIEYQAN